MAYTVTNVERDVSTFHKVIATIDITSLAAAGTEALTASDFGLSQVHGVAILGQANGGYHVTYDHVNNAVDVTYGDYDAAADGALIDVPVGTAIGEVVVELTGV